MFGVASCANIGNEVKHLSISMTPEQKVMQRAEARWNAILEGKVDVAYGIISPAGRLRMPLEEYRLRVNTQYARKVRVASATCEVELCEVTLDFDYVLNGLPLSQVITEKWVLDGGEWWFVYRG